MLANAPRHYFLVGLTALLLVSIPLSTAERLRSISVAMLSPLWHRLNILAVVGFDKKVSSKDNLRKPLTTQELLEASELENNQLKDVVKRLSELLASEQELADQAHILPSEELNPAMRRRQQERRRLIDMQILSAPARVLFRSPTSWNSFLWLDVGEADNKALGRSVVAKNSPVVVGRSLVGIVDLVNTHQSRVRLITDSSISPSVRAVRGDIQRQELLEHLDAVAGGLAHDEQLFRSDHERSQVLELLLDLRERFQRDRASWQLAKGELHGSVLPLWRRKGNMVRGVGFNYDFADEEGPARDLITGRVIGGQGEADIQLLKVDDLLVTTGLDGVLPAGLQVAKVTKVFPLGEGDYFYDLEARPAIGDMDALSLVWVLPPLKPLENSK